MLPWQFHNFTCEMINWRWNFAPKLTCHRYGSALGGMKHNETAEPITESDSVLSNRERLESFDCLHWFTSFLSTKNFGLIFLSLFYYYFFMFCGLVAIYRELPVEIDVLKKMLTVNRIPWPCRGSGCEWTVWAIFDSILCLFQNKQFSNASIWW